MCHIGIVGTAIGDQPDGSSGRTSASGIGIWYSKTSDTDYSILLDNAASTSLGLIDVNGNTYIFNMDLSGMPEESTIAGAGRTTVTLTYTDANTWSITFLLAEMDCSEDDLAAPERMRVHIDKANGLWIGKAMLYNPRWVNNGGITCSTEPTDASSMDFYTNFVGSNTATKASIYMMQRDKNSLDDIADYEMSDIGNNFAGGAVDTSPYRNPLCNIEGSTSITWGETCQFYDTAVASTDYGPATDWVTPYDLYHLTVDIPSWDEFRDFFMSR